eukprot:scaffold12484_cov75-Skeletonema_dohrnii-CCMP3373.AAC.1
MNLLWELERTSSVPKYYLQAPRRIYRFARCLFPDLPFSKDGGNLTSRFLRIESEKWCGSSMLSRLHSYDSLYH